MLMGCARNTQSLYRTKPNPRMRRKMATSNAMVLKSDCKLLKLAMEEMEDLSCQNIVGCERVLTKKHLHDLEGVKGDCRPERLCHMLVSPMQSCTYAYKEQTNLSHPLSSSTISLNSKDKQALKIRIT